MANSINTSCRGSGTFIHHDPWTTRNVNSSGSQSCPFKQKFKRGLADGLFWLSMNVRLITKLAWYVLDEPLNDLLLDGKPSTLRLASRAIKAKRGIAYVDEMDMTPLHIAASKANICGYVQIAEDLIHAGVDDRKKNKLKQTAFHMAAEVKNSYNFLVILLLNGRSSGIKDDEGNLPIHLAYMIKHDPTEPNALNMLNAYSDEIVFTDRNNLFKTPYQIAIEQGNDVVVKAMVKRCKNYGWCFDSNFSGGQNPVQVAIEKGHFEMANWLIEQRGKVKVIVADLSHGIEANPLYVAIKSDSVGFVNWMIGKGYLRDKGKKEAKKALQLAKESGSKEIIEAIKAQGEG